MIASDDVTEGLRLCDAVTGNKGAEISPDGKNGISRAVDIQQEGLNSIIVVRESHGIGGDD